MKFSIYVRGRTNLDTRIEKLAMLGYDGVELTGEPSLFSPKEVCYLLRKHGLEASSVSLSFPEHMAERDLANTNTVMRSKAVEYVKRCIDFANELEAPLIIVVPTIVRAKPPDSIRKSWNLAVYSIREIGEYAMRSAVQVCIEPTNRHNTYLVNDSREAKDFIKDVGVKNVKLVLDCYHMTIEREDIPTAIKNAGEDLIHLHMADVNHKDKRVPLGKGYLNFQSIIESLNEIRYKGYLTMEASTRDYLSIEAGTISEDYLFKFAEDSILHLRSLNMDTAK